MFPKLNKLIVVCGTTGFTTSITVFDDDDDELKSLLVQLPSDKATWLVCSWVEGVLDPLHALSEV